MMASTAKDNPEDPPPTPPASLDDFAIDRIAQSNTAMDTKQSALVDQSKNSIPDSTEMLSTSSLFIDSDEELMGPRDPAARSALSDVGNCLTKPVIPAQQLEDDFTETLGRNVLLPCDNSTTTSDSDSDQTVIHSPVGVPNPTITATSAGKITPDEYQGQATRRMSIRDIIDRDPEDGEELNYLAICLQWGVEYGPDWTMEVSILKKRHKVVGRGVLWRTKPCTGSDYDCDHQHNDLKPIDRSEKKSPDVSIESKNRHFDAAYGTKVVMDEDELTNQPLPTVNKSDPVTPRRVSSVSFSGVADNQEGELEGVRTEQESSLTVDRSRKNRGSGGILRTPGSKRKVSRKVSFLVQEPESTVTYQKDSSDESSESGATSSRVSPLGDSNRDPFVSPRRRSDSVHNNKLRKSLQDFKHSHSATNNSPNSLSANKDVTMSSDSRGEREWKLVTYDEVTGEEIVHDSAEDAAGASKMKVDTGESINEQIEGDVSDNTSNDVTEVGTTTSSMLAETSIFATGDQNVTSASDDEEPPAWERNGPKANYFNVSSNVSTAYAKADRTYPFLPKDHSSNEVKVLNVPRAIDRYGNNGNMGPGGTGVTGSDPLYHDNGRRCTVPRIRQPHERKVFNFEPAFPTGFGYKTDKDLMPAPKKEAYPTFDPTPKIVMRGFGKPLGKWDEKELQRLKGRPFENIMSNADFKKFDKWNIEPMSKTDDVREKVNPKSSNGRSPEGSQSSSFGSRSSTPSTDAGTSENPFRAKLYKDGDKYGKGKNKVKDLLPIVEGPSNLEHCYKCGVRHIEPGPPSTLNERDTCKTYVPEYLPTHLSPVDAMKTFVEKVNESVTYGKVLAGLAPNEGEHGGPELKSVWEHQYHEKTPEWRAVGRNGGYWTCRLGSTDPIVPQIERNCKVCSKYNAVKQAELDHRDRGLTAFERKKFAKEREEGYTTYKLTTTVESNKRFLDRYMARQMEKDKAEAIKNLKEGQIVLMDSGKEPVIPKRDFNATADKKNGDSGTGVKKIPDIGATLWANHDPSKNFFIPALKYGPVAAIGYDKDLNKIPEKKPREPITKPDDERRRSQSLGESSSTKDRKKEKSPDKKKKRNSFDFSLKGFGDSIKGAFRGKKE